MDPAWRTWFRDNLCPCSSSCAFSMPSDSWISQAVFLCSWKPVPRSVQHCWVILLALAWAFAALTTWNQLAETMLIFGKKRSSESDCFVGRNRVTCRCLSLVLGLTSPNSLLQDMKRWRVIKLGHITSQRFSASSKASICSSFQSFQSSQSTWPCRWGGLGCGSTATCFSGMMKLLSPLVCCCRIDSSVHST